MLIVWIVIFSSLILPQGLNIPSLDDHFSSTTTEQCILCFEKGLNLCRSNKSIMNKSCILNPICNITGNMAWLWYNECQLTLPHQSLAHIASSLVYGHNMFHIIESYLFIDIKCHIIPDVITNLSFLENIVRNILKPICLTSCKVRVHINCSPMQAQKDYQNPSPRFHPCRHNVIHLCRFCSWIDWLCRITNLIKCTTHRPPLSYFVFLHKSIAL